MNKKIMFASIDGVVLLTALVAAAVLYASIPTSVSVSEALSTTTLSVSLSGFPGETLTKNIDVNNVGSVALNTRVSFAEDSNVNGVTYTTNMPETVLLAPGANTVTVTYTILNDSPVGDFNGTIQLDRTA